MIIYIDIEDTNASEIAIENCSMVLIISLEEISLTCDHAKGFLEGKFKNHNFNQNAIRCSSCSKKLTELGSFIPFPVKTNSEILGLNFFQDSVSGIFFCG